MHMTVRELVRRWYGQLRGQPYKVASDLRYLAAHTIVPSQPDQLSFGAIDFVPLSQAMDLALTTELNGADEVMGLSLRAYRASFDADTNTLQIGGENNFLAVKDLKLRPFIGGCGRILDPHAEGAMLQVAMHMEGEREAARRRSNLLWTAPDFAGAVLSFIKDDKTPKYQVTPGLINLAWMAVQPNAAPLQELCAPGDARTVKTVYRDRKLNVTLVELDNGFCAEAPAWAKVHVIPNQFVHPGQSLMTLGLPYDLLKSLWTANQTLESIWEGLSSYLGEQASNWLLRAVYDDMVTDWGGMRMIPHYLVPQEQVRNANAVWRDLRGRLGREYRSCRNPGYVEHFERRQGRIAVWNMGQPASIETLTFDTLGGPVDLFSVPSRNPKAGVIYAGPTLYEEQDEPLPILPRKAG